jgi:transcriptional regulator with XRE-family HTH domain
MQIGDAIASFRNLKGVNQKKMANDLGISVTYLSLVENNKEKPSIKKISEIAKYLNIPVSALLFKVLEKKNFKDAKSRRLFKTAEPVVEKIINILISEGNKMKAKRPSSVS